MPKITLSLVIWLAGPSVALACTLAHVPDFDIDDSIDEREPPAAAVIKEVRVTRGKPPSRHDGGVVQSSSCDDIGFVRIELVADAPDVGYFLARVDGELPNGLTLPAAARPARGLSLHWVDGATDDQDAFVFTLRITSVDRAGNLGEPVEIVIEDDGLGERVSRAGCGTVTVPHLAHSVEKGSVSDGQRQWPAVG